MQPEGIDNLKISVVELSPFTPHFWIILSSLADTSWGGVNLAMIDWSGVKKLGDETNLHQDMASGGDESKDKW